MLNRFQETRGLISPFANLPEKKSGRWNAGLSAKKMADCR
jgi:hypothetical protein